MKTTRLKKSEWRNGIWVTRVALVLGAVAIGVGIIDPRFYQVKVFSCLAMAAIATSIAGLGMSLWRIEPRSRRLRAPIFWFSLIANLALILSVGFLLLRSMSLPPIQRPSDNTLIPEAN